MIRLVHDNLICTADGRWVAVYRLPAVSYPYLPERSKVRLHTQLASFATQVGADFTLHRVTRTTARGDALPEIYLTIEALRPDRSGLAQRALSKLRLPARAALRVAGAELERARARERELLALVRHLSGRRAHTGELCWLYRRAPLRAIIEPFLDSYAEPDALIVHDQDGGSYQGIGATLDELVDCHLTERADHVVAESVHGASHQAVLIAGALPADRTFPGGELLFEPLEAARTVVDVCVRCVWVPNARALRLARRQLLDADNAQAEHDIARRHADTRLDEQHETAAAFRTYLESDTAPPILRAQISFLIAARSSEQLDHAIRDLATRTAPVAVTRPAFIQRRLWRQHLPGAAPSVMLGEQLVTVEQFAALMPIASEACGTQAGPTIGVLPRSRRHVFLDLTAASRESRPPSLLLVGSQGAGKTMAAQLIASHTAARRGRVIDVDPKPDHHLDQLPELRDAVQVIDLTAAGATAGLLDPMLLDAATREELTTGFLTQLAGTTEPEVSAQIRRVIRALPAAATSRDVLVALERGSSRSARRVARQLATLADTPLTSLAFASTPIPGGGDSRAVTTIRCRALTLPAPTLPRTERSEPERISVALMGLIAAYAMRLATTDPARHKLVLIDEAWALLGSSEGRALIDRLNRTGRAHNASLLLATQHITDAGDLTDLIGTHLAFGQETTRQATQVLELLGLDVTDELLDQLTTMRRGACLMRDIDGRVAHVQITPPAELLRLLDTTPPGEAAV